MNGGIMNPGSSKSSTGLYFDSYGEINNGAHRKAAELTGAPAFVWHQAIWLPAASVLTEPKTSRHDIVKGYITGLYKHIENSISDRIHDKDVIKKIYLPPRHLMDIREDDRVRVISYELYWRGLRSRIRVENHTEYVTITSIIDASSPLDDDTKTAVADDVKRCLSIFSRIGLGVKQNPPTNDQISQCHEFIYDKIWKIFFEEILNIPVTHEEGSSEKYLENSVFPNVSAGALGPRFADFRGFISASRYPCDRAGNQICPVVPLQKDQDCPPCYFEMVEPFLDKDLGSRGQSHQDGYPNEAWSRTILNRAWPFLEVAGRDHKSPISYRFEFSASRLLDGRALYVSSLGPQPDLWTDSPSEQVNTPVHFYIHSITQCEREIGRLVDTLTTLATLRLAAIIALPDLKTVRVSLSIIDNDIKNVRKDIHNLIKISPLPNNPKKDNKKELSASILGQLDFINQKVTDLSNGDHFGKERTTKLNGKAITLKESDKMADPRLGKATLEYRLERSQFYRESFNDNLSLLRIQRIEGFQPYDEFINRRLKSSHRYIEDIEGSVNHTIAEWRSLDQLYLTSEITMLTYDLRDQGKKLEQEQKAIMNLQFGAEAAFALLLGPYYASSLIIFLIKTHDEIHQAFRWSNVEVNSLVSGAMWVLGGLFYLWRRHEFRRAAAERTEVPIAQIEDFSQ
jgi:hypothetical protein